MTPTAGIATRPAPTPDADAGVPLSVPDLSGRERAYAAQALADGEFGPSGPFRDRFETLWAARNGTRRAITLSSGTAALHVALAALGIGAGDEVVVPGMTYVASANAVLHAGATPVFADVDPETWCLSPEAVAAAITPRTRAIMPVHLFGLPCDMDGLAALARPAGIALVADAAHAPLALYGGRPVAEAAKLTMHSFFHNKTLTCGEGGALLVDDPDLAEIATELRAHGLGMGGGAHYRRLGYNYRLTNLACAILCGQAERADSILAACAALDARYRERLPAGIRPQGGRAGTLRDHWMFPVLPPPDAPPRDEIMARLGEQRIGCRPFFPTPGAVGHLAPYGAGRPLPVSEHLAGAGLMLPLRATMTAGDVDRVVEALARALR